MNIFSERYKQLGEPATTVETRQAIRVNTLKTTKEKLIKRLEARHIEVEEIPFLENGLYIIRSPFAVVSTPEYLLGLFYIQEAASQLPVPVLNPKKLCLDACAAPGSKTTQIAEQCPVIAVDSREDRLVALQNNVERLGITNCKAYNLDFRGVKDKFDYILLDAPCSGNFVTEGKMWFRKQSMKRIQERSELQKSLISHAIELLNKNGTLVYSTCSLEPEENELIIQYALENHKIKLETVNTIGDPGITNPFDNKLNSEIKKCRRLWPWKTNTQGFFIAKIRKC
ncbi:SAM-dependent tRNA/rRNA cytosine-C5 methylase [archaeon]|nr:SAM-dependent tRNA/rRNA cytosine-C5 methylase [archaeon]